MLQANEIFCGFATAADPEKIRCGSERRGDGWAGNPTSNEAPEHLGETDLGTRAARGCWESRTSGRTRWGRSGDPDGEGTEEGFRDVREEGIGGDRSSKFSRSSLL